MFETLKGIQSAYLYVSFIVHRKKQVCGLILDKYNELTLIVIQTIYQIKNQSL